MTLTIALTHGELHRLKATGEPQVKKPVVYELIKNTARTNW